MTTGPAMLPGSGTYVPEDRAELFGLLEELEGFLIRTTSLHTAAREELEKAQAAELLARQERKACVDDLNVVRACIAARMADPIR